MQAPSTQPIDTRSAEQCQQVIAALPITNVAVAHQTLATLLKGMYRAPPPPADYLAVLEQARESLAFLQESVATRYAAKPLPATEDETAAFERTVDLWRTMASSYARVAQQGGGALEAQLALVCQRCIHYAGQSILEYYRARRTVSAGLWLDFYGYFDTAEDWGLADAMVAEPLGEEPGNVSCATTFATILLVDLANPYSRSAREQALVMRWAQTMSISTGIRHLDANGGSRGYGIDLMQDRGLLPIDQLATRPTARVFDTSRLGDRMQRLLAELKTGRTPASMGLGDCSKAQASRLLLQLYRPWCLAAIPRRFQRDAASGTLAVAYGLDAIYFHITGHEFSQPSHMRSFSRSEVESMCTFGSMVESAQPVSTQTAKRDHALDRWDVADQSSHGFRAFRQAAGPRIEYGQLVALQAPGNRTFLLGRVTWLVLEKDGRLQAGFLMLPHPAAGISIRPSGLSVAASDKYSLGFFVPAVPSLKEPVSVVLPLGWFNPGRVIEVFTDRKISVQLGEILNQGANFERCTFTLMK